MKVLALVILVVGSSSGLGSGPYLPSGWRPSGPAFYLPTETEKSTAAVPLKDAPVQETVSSGSSFLREYGTPQELQVEEVKAQEQETSGSDALREYGPPKAGEVAEVSQDLTVQALPDPVTEQAFVVIQATSNEEDKSADVVVDAENASVNAVETTKEETSANSEGREDKTIDVETQTESSLAVNEETEEVVKDNVEVGQTAAAIQQDSEVNNVVVEKSEEVVEVKVMEEGVKNIADALVNLENEIKAQQVQTEVTVLRGAQESQGLNQQAPAGFLEYGPPGFTEYGPPKGNLVAAEESSPVSSFETNEARRRRFSPKFRKPSRKA